jgi:hypothetical protein
MVALVSKATRACNWPDNGGFARYLHTYLSTRLRVAYDNATGSIDRSWPVIKGRDPHRGEPYTCGGWLVVLDYASVLVVNREWKPERKKEEVRIRQLFANT